MPDSALGGGRGVGREGRSGMSVGNVSRESRIGPGIKLFLFCFVFVCFVLKSPNPGRFRKTPRQQKSIMSRKKLALCGDGGVSYIFLFNQRIIGISGYGRSDQVVAFPTDIPDRHSRPTFPTDIPDLPTDLPDPPPGEPTHTRRRRRHTNTN